MYVIEKLRLNKFSAQPVLSARELARTVGLSDPKFQSQQTAKDMEVVIPFGAKKTQTMALGQEMASKAAEFIDNPNAKPLDFKQPKDM